MADTFAESQVPFLDMAANQVELGQKIAAQLAPRSPELGLALTPSCAESVACRRNCRTAQRAHRHDMLATWAVTTQFQVRSPSIAAANEGGGAAG